MTKHSWKTPQIVLCILTAIILTTSFSLEYALQMSPCPLCVMQRFSALLLGICLLVALRFKTLPRGLLFTQLLFACAGLYFASRQLWLMSIPPSEALTCMPGLSVLVHYFPLKDVVNALLWGTGECTENPWRFLGLSMPAWSLLYFCIASIGILMSGCHAKSKAV